jgi:hypothetical protein
VCEQLDKLNGVDEPGEAWFWTKPIRKKEEEEEEEGAEDREEEEEVEEEVCEFEPHEQLTVKSNLSFALVGLKNGKKQCLHDQRKRYYMNLNAQPLFHPDISPNLAR